MGVKIRQKVKGKGKPWWVFIVHNGKRTSKKVGDKTAAEKVASEIRARLQLGDFNFEDEKPIPTFKEYADSWRQTTAPANCKESTIENHERLLKNHILPVFGSMEIASITRKTIKDFLYSKLNGGLSKSTVNSLRAVISDVLNIALDDQVIQSNLAHGLGRIGKNGEGKKEIQPLSTEELRTLLDTIQADERLSRHYPLFLLLARTGLRIGEAVALRWNDMDFDKGTIFVERTYTKGRLGTCKNGKSRSVDMSKQLKGTLLRVKADRTTIPMDEGSDWIFTYKDSLIVADTWRCTVFNKAVKKAGIKRITPHDTRHTYATLRLSQGDTLATVANQLGDTQIEVLRTYSHYIPDTQTKTEVDALDDPGYKEQNYECNYQRKT